MGGETGNTGFNYADLDDSTAEGIREEMVNVKGLFADLDVNSNKLGATVIKRNEKLVKLLKGALRAEIDKIIAEIGI